MSSSSTSARLSWIDTVKGITILLVALHHAAGMAAMKPWSGEELVNFSDAMKTIRMPLFFAMSGFFFLRRADRTWGWFLRNRTGPLLWLFTIWTFLWAAVFLVIPWQRDVDYDMHDALRLFVDPGVGPWFIFALALYFTAMKMLHPLPTWVQLLIGCAVSLPVGCGFIHIEIWAWESVLMYFITFQLGVFGSKYLTDLSAHATLPRLIVLGFLWGVGSGLLYVLFGDFMNLGRIPVTLLGMAMGITAASLMARHTPWLYLDRLGRHTLPIYLLHVPLLGVLYSIDVSLPANAAVSIGVPLLLTILAVAGSLAIWRVLRPIPGLFTAPWTGDGANTRSPRVSEIPSGRHRSDARNSCEKAERPAR